MKHEDARPPVVVVTGPTASGKSACAIRLACSSVGEDFGWARPMVLPLRIKQW